MQIFAPIPDPLRADAARLWWRSFGRDARLMGGRRSGIDHSRGAVAVRGGRIAGVIGLRDGAGGFAPPSRGPLALIFRPAPPTADLVIDGICVDRAMRRTGTGAALIQSALAQARRAGRPGLRAEVAASNRAALAFYRKAGFVEIGRGRYGWPWVGQVVMLRRAA